jgi:hypothetical protein
MPGIGMLAGDERASVLFVAAVAGAEVCCELFCAELFCEEDVRVVPAGVVSVLRSPQPVSANASDRSVSAASFVIMTDRNRGDGAAVS